LWFGVEIAGFKASGNREPSEIPPDERDWYLHTIAAACCTGAGTPCNVALTAKANEYQEKLKGQLGAGDLTPRDTSATCAHCRRYSLHLKSDFKQCSVRKKAYYCSVGCQRADYKARHKKEYTPAKDLKELKKA
jgi:hypothetical protein